MSGKYPDPYRVGRSLGRTIYRYNKLIGIMDDPEDACFIVSLLNRDAEDQSLKLHDGEVDRGASEQS